MEQQIKIKNVMSYEDNKLRMPEISRTTEPDLSRWAGLLSAAETVEGATKSIVTRGSGPCRKMER
jgi:hypothetical protein